MPLYDYSCSCGWVGTKLSNSENSDKQFCPECSKLLQKLISAPTTIKINGVKATASQH